MALFDFMQGHMGGEGGRGLKRGRARERLQNTSDSTARATAPSVCSATVVKPPAAAALKASRGLIFQLPSATPSSHPRPLLTVADRARTQPPPPVSSNKFFFFFFFFLFVVLLPFFERKRKTSI